MRVLELLSLLIFSLSCGCVATTQHNYIPLAGMTSAQVLQWRSTSPF